MPTVLGLTATKRLRVNLFKESIILGAKIAKKLKPA